MAELCCTNCKNIADFGGNYVECVLLHRFVDWYYWKSFCPDDCPLREVSDDESGSREGSKEVKRFDK